LQCATPVAAGDQLQRRGFQLREQRPHGRLVPLAGRREAQALSHPFEQGHASPSLQLLHLFADRALCEVQGLGRARDAAKARGGGKCAQQVQGWG
jgi:hypothetical protein